MASALWGKIYYQDTYAGELRQEPGGRCVFTYDAAYLDARRPAIAFTLPLGAQPHICEQGLHPFFDNLAAEGWLRNAQARALKVDARNRFALLLAFGHDCAGAVTVIDPTPRDLSIELNDTLAGAAVKSRASLSGIQPKVLAVREGRSFRPARGDERSTYLAKLPSGTLRDIVENEYLTTTACRALLPDDRIVELEIAPLKGVQDRALLVRRFDRMPSGARLHFEEFNQLLGHRADDDRAKYDASCEDMAEFILATPGCTPVDAWRLCQRVLACFLTGNTDAHLKNFAMFHTPDGLRLTPAYDLVAAALYDFPALALRIGNAEDFPIVDLKPKHIIKLGKAHGLDRAALGEIVRVLGLKRKTAELAVRRQAGRIEAVALGDNLLAFMEKRWNGTFASIGKLLSKKPSGDDDQ